ncbi:hypothetical protein [Bacterioplanoides sp.]|uniref:hypothetical protein n=1 Tax=Bacterioplanoides sp. TaxID=2066072 RepID=UPI003B5B4D10
MNIKRAVNVNRLLQAVVGVLFIATMQVFLVSALVAIGKQQTVTTSDNTWLELADVLSFSDPEVFAALATYQREQAVLSGEDKRAPLLQQSLLNWEQAIESRPLWPYHHLNALHVEVMLNKPALDIQQRIDTVISQTPNERGMDKYLVELAVFSWPKLNRDQRRWISDRLDILSGKELKYVLKAAERINRKTLVCVHLPIKKSRRYCK